MIPSEVCYVLLSLIYLYHCNMCSSSVKLVKDTTIIPTSLLVRTRSALKLQKKIKRTTAGEEQMLKTIHEFLLIQRRTLMYRKNCVGVEVPGTVCVCVTLNV